MAEKNSLNRRDSRYVSGGTTEFKNNKIEWWERNVIASSKDDIVYYVEKKFNGRLDLIATLFLGEPKYAWVIAQYNNILDMHDEVKEGAIIYIPTLEKVNAILNGRLGGVDSKRVISTSILPIV
jgi:hypothetical protein